MWNDLADDTGDFPKLNKIDKIYIEGSSGTQLERSITVFSNWMMSESQPGLDHPKKLDSRIHVKYY